MKSAVRVLSMLLLLLITATGLSAQVFRIGSSAPENSPWGRTLNRLAAEWQQITDGRVRVQIFHNSIAGDEADMVRKMRIGQLQAVAMTATGLSSFSDGILTLSMPLLIRDQDEYDYVFEQVRDRLEAGINAHGLHVLSWSTAGWLHFFSREPMSAQEELRRVRLAASPEEMKLVRAYQLMGFQPIPVPYTERLAALASGMVNAYLTVPILAAGFQWFAATPHMLDVPVGPAPGAIVMSERAFRQLPRDVRDEMVAVARRVAAGLDRDILELEANAIETMSEHGLEIINLNERELDVWLAEFSASYDVTLGLVFDERLYERIKELLRAYRAGR